MSENVIRLDGNELALPNGAEPEVIALLEEALECAKRGEYIAVGFIGVAPNAKVRAQSTSRHKHSLVAGCEYLKYDLIGA